MKYIADKNGHWIPASEFISEGHMVMSDIKPYQSMINGEMITSRSQHREHLRQHDCFEIGNEKQTFKGMPDANPKQRHELIRNQIDSLRHEDFKRAIKRDVDNVKWNSRDK